MAQTITHFKINILFTFDLLYFTLFTLIYWLWRLWRCSC